MIWIVYVKGRAMLEYDEPYITTLTLKLDYSKAGKKSWGDYPMTMLEILDQGFSDTIDLENENYKRYVHIFAKNIYMV